MSNVGSYTSDPVSVSLVRFVGAGTNYQRFSPFTEVFVGVFLAWFRAIISAILATGVPSHSSTPSSDSQGTEIANVLG